MQSQDFQSYLLLRYHHLEDSLEEMGEAGIHDILSFEALLLDSVLEREADTPILDQIARPSSKEEYLDFSVIEEPPREFREAWESAITFDRKEVLRDFVIKTYPDDPLTDPEYASERIDIARDILEILSCSYIDPGRFDFLLNPIYPIGDGTLVVPFPDVLISTAQYRIEEYLSELQEVQEKDNLKKGETVEDLSHQLLQRIPSRNFIKQFYYIGDRNHGEADGLLLFEDSYWIVEVKSHPLFRKIPSNLDVVHRRFVEKTGEAVDQVERGHRYLEDETEEFGLVYNLTGDKSRSEAQTGGIIILDGFLPTLYSGNERADRQMGTGALHDKIDPDDRILVLTLYDLYQLTEQQEVDQFEDFLLWRTDYEGTMPVWGYSEREYWAFYFDLYCDDEEFRNAVDESAAKDIVTIYISERFNDKSHLTEIDSQR